jgi:aspartate aminotransferase
VEYGFYTRNAGGVPRFVETKENFDLDLDAIAAAITAKTKVILINTPNNPTGKIYPQAQLTALAALLTEQERQLGTCIYLLSDTPYAKITYDGLKNPKLLGEHANSILVHSHSKDLGLAGERIGYLLINPDAAYRDDLRAAFSFNNRTLGFIHAPAMMQYALRSSLRASIDVDHYRELREMLCNGLRQLGFDFETPQGAFYLFPKTPIADDVEFCRLAQEHNLLLVPGSGFGRAGHVRIAYCVKEATIERALPQFEKLMSRFKQ